MRQHGKRIFQQIYTDETRHSQRQAAHGNNYSAEYRRDSGGAIQLETLFSWQGLGQLMYDAFKPQGLPMLQGCFFISTAAVILVNVIMDILYGFIDPRVKD